MASPAFGDLPSVAPLNLSATVAGDGHVVLTVTGEVDMSTCDHLDRTLTDLLRRRPHRLELDVAELRFLDSSGIRVLIHAARSARLLGCRLSLRDAAPGVRRVLEITGVASLVGLDVDSDGQVEAVSSPDSTR